MEKSRVSTPQSSSNAEFSENIWENSNSFKETKIINIKMDMQKRNSNAILNKSDIIPCLMPSSSQNRNHSFKFRYSKASLWATGVQTK